MKFVLALALAATSTAALAAQERFVVITGGKTVGHLWADTNDGTTTIDYDVKNNGRGPTVKERLSVDASGLPTAWQVGSITTFGSKQSESFARNGRRATWTDATGKGAATAAAPALYVAQSASPWADGLYARALMRAGNALPALPGGTLKLERGIDVTLNGRGGPLPTTAYTISGISTSPDLILLDAAGNLVAQLDARAVLVREGYEGEEVRLRDLAANLASARWASIQREVAHNYAAPVRIRNVRLFDPATGKLTGVTSVVVNGRTIAGVLPDDSPATPGEVIVDGAGGTLVPGMVEMHGHIGEGGALLNVLAGITTVRDMGNDNAVLDGLIGRIERGEVGGPRIVRAGFIEGKSPYSANNGFVVDSEAKALEAVRWYAARDYWAIKSYNSINPAWIPAMVREAHRLGLKVIGHIPAFTNADAMIDAGYDELTHLNQLALGWVIKPNEDTRTLFRITAQQRLPALDLRSTPVQATLARLKAKGIGLDDTFVIHEWLFRSRDGQPQPQVADVIDHLPIADQRDARQAVTDLATIGGDANARATFTQLTNIMRMLKDAGVPLIPGTDMGGSFAYHHELELYQTLGFTPSEILTRATLDMQRYLGRDQSLGSIAKGKLADFFLVAGDPTRDLKAIKAIAMVVKDGQVYFPAEAYPKVGIKPFAPAPRVTLPKAVASAAAPTGAGEARGLDAFD